MVAATDTALGVDVCVEAYEAARRRAGAAKVVEHLPPRSAPHYAAALAELVRVDMEYAWAAGRPRDAASYLVEFPALAADRLLLGEIAYEEYRQRLDRGERPDRNRYRRELGVDPDAWPSDAADDDEEKTAVTPAGPMAVGTSQSVATTLDAVENLPEVGDEFLGFRLDRELGRGAFARVFLARQGGLSDRPVALKVSAEFLAEPRTLARLQHTNIVPVYSVHAVNDLQAVCMPYFGSTTLADLTGELRRSDSLPHSGQHIVSTLANRKASTLRPDDRSGPVPLPTLPDLPRVASDTLDRLAHLSYIEAVLTLAAQVADGLSHAHERGVIHRDIKPANVLLTDDGRAMLLDFNLAANADRAGSRAGGTLSYMAPESIDAFLGLPAKVDGRSDIYALGLVLWELLAGRPAYPMPSGPIAQSLPKLARMRAGDPPPLRAFNPAVSPAVESIVRTCLAGTPAHRYQTAGALRDDIERHLANETLLVAPEPSLRERAAKWRRRHPRLATAVPLAAVLVAAGLSLAAVTDRASRNAGIAAAERWRVFENESADLVTALSRGTADHAAFGPSLEASRRTLDRYGVLTDAAWATRPAVRALPAENQDVLRREVGELLFLTADATAFDARLRNVTGGLAEADRLSALAADSFPDGTAPAVVERFRAALAAERAGRPAPPPVEPTTPREAYLRAADLALAGQVLKARDMARRAVDGDPTLKPAWFLLAKCLARTGQLRRAEAAYDTCLALNPKMVAARVNRGAVRAQLAEYAAAKADFDAALAARPDDTDTRVNRAIVRQALGDLSGARDDLTAALDAGTPPTRALFLRARVNAKLGDKAAAAADTAAGLARTPADELSWVARGTAKLGRDDAGALADFDEALRQYPGSRAALQNKAHVLSERLNRPADAVAALDALLAAHPDDFVALGGRGVLHARRGDRDRAVADATACLALDREPSTLHMVASVHALLAPNHADDRDAAMKLLAEALRANYDPKHLTDDRDLDALRSDPAFERMLASRGGRARFGMKEK